MVSYNLRIPVDLFGVFGVLWGGGERIRHQNTFGSGTKKKGSATKDLAPKKTTDRAPKHPRIRHQTPGQDQAPNTRPASGTKDQAPKQPGSGTKNTHRIKHQNETDQAPRIRQQNNTGSATKSLHRISYRILEPTDPSANPQTVVFKNT